MKTLITIFLLLISAQASAYTIEDYQRYQAASAHFQQLVTELASQSDTAELTLNLAYRKTTRSSNLFFVTRLTQGFNNNVVYQHGYQYVCKRVKRHTQNATARFSGCSEINYVMDYRRNIKKALL